jgi:tetratricopeptide (TPR) repeat protein
VHHPKDVGLRIAYGRVLLANGDFEEARDEFTRAADSAPDDPRPVAWQVAAYSRQCEFKEALAVVDRAPKELKEHAEILVAMGRVHLDASCPREALPVLEQAFAAAGDPVAAGWRAVCHARLYQWEKAEQLARDAIDAADKDDMHAVAQANYRLGRIMADHQRHDEALKWLEAALKAEPGHLKALEWQATALRGQGDYENALKSALAVLDAHPRLARMHIEAAWVLCEEGDPGSGAIDHAEQALKYRPRGVSAHCTLIEIYCKRREYPKAVACGERALEDCGYSPRIQTAVALAYAEQRQWDEALAYVEAALRIAPGYSWALRSKIEYLAQQHDHRRVDLAIENAVSVRGEDPRVRTAAAWALSKAGQFTRALEMTERALEIDPSNCWALWSKINFLRQARRMSDAEDAIAQALAARPIDPDMYTAAAWVASDGDREDEAVSRVTEALKIDPCNAAALTARIYFQRWGRHYEEAFAAAADARDKRGDDPGVLAAVGWLYSDWDWHDEAIGCIEEAIRRNPYDSWLVTCHLDFLRAKGEYGAARRVVHDALGRRQFKGDPYLLVASGWLYGDHAQYQQALDAFDQALGTCPLHLDALLWRVITLRAMLRLDEALKEANEAIRLRPDDLALRIELGRTLDATNARAEALTNYARVTDKDPCSVDVLLARSSALRSLRRYADAEREIKAALTSRQKNPDLLAELGWIYYDQRLLADARDAFGHLYGEAVNERERALAVYGLGWVAFAEEEYRQAEASFRDAVQRQPDNLHYDLGLAWALAKQDGRIAWDEAGERARRAAKARPDPFAHVCLGTIAYKQCDLPGTEYHLKRAVELDAYQGGYADLGALYVSTARHDEARKALDKAVALDWNDAAAHKELGCLLLTGDGNARAAEQEFRQARKIDPPSVRAAIGLARALAEQGRDGDAENVLREALSQCDARRVGRQWRLHVGMAWLLARQGTDRQDAALLSRAYEEAREAVDKAPGKKGEAHYAAAMVQLRQAAIQRVPTRKQLLIRSARKHLQAAADDDYPDAKRYLNLLGTGREQVDAVTLGGLILLIVSILLLALMWTAFLAGDKVSATTVSADTPVLVGLVAVSALLRELTKLKVPGFEADLQPTARPDIIGPTGDDSFGPGRLNVPLGPLGEVPRHGDGRLHHAKNTKHT